MSRHGILVILKLAKVLRVLMVIRRVLLSVIASLKLLFTHLRSAGRSSSGLFSEHLRSNVYCTIHNVIHEKEFCEMNPMRPPSAMSNDLYQIFIREE